MRIGIVADIHDAIGPLRRALGLLRDRGVDRIVTLGDAFESYQAGGVSSEVAALLEQAGAVGVWGNHDVGLSHEVSDRVRNVADQALLAFTTQLEPHLVLEGCRFSHIEPWKDPRLVEHLWGSDALPETADLAQRSFQAVPERLLFIGHFHTWLAVSAGGRAPWDGTGPISLREPDRYLVVISAVVDGWCATFDTRQSLLTPIRCSG